MGTKEPVPSEVGFDAPGPYTDILQDADGDPGIHEGDLAGAIQTWSWMQRRPVSVAEAALAFNTTVDIVRQAVEYYAAAAPDEPLFVLLARDKHAPTLLWCGPRSASWTARIRKRSARRVNARRI